MSTLYDFAVYNQTHCNAGTVMVRPSRTERWFASREMVKLNSHSRCKDKHCIWRRKIKVTTSTEPYMETTRALSPIIQAPAPRPTLTLCSFTHLSMRWRARSSSVERNGELPCWNPSLWITSSALITGIMVISVNGTTEKDMMPPQTSRFRREGEDVKYAAAEREMADATPDVTKWNCIENVLANEAKWYI